MITRLEIDQALGSLAGRRPVFHSEADFQHELAVEIRDLFQCKIRLEVPKAIKINGAPTKAEIDLLVRTPPEDNWTAIELKYCKRAANLTHQDEQFALANSWGTNLSRFDCLADLMRVEAIVAAGHAKQGFAVFLTNAPEAWQTDVGVTTNMAGHFSIHEARAIPAGASLDWNPPNPPVGSVSVKRKAPYAPITIAREQTCRWTDFSDLRQANGTFRYLVLEGSASTKTRPADEAEQQHIVFDAITSASLKTPPAYMALYPGQPEERGGSDGGLCCLSANSSEGEPTPRAVAGERHDKRRS